MNVPWAIPNITAEDIEYVKSVLDTGWYTMGKNVKHVETSLATLVGRRFGIAVTNGTAALEVVLRALDIGHGDEVIVPAVSYIASANTVSLVGAIPVFADVDAHMTLNPQQVEQMITSKTKAVMAVDLTGSPCDYDHLSSLCDQKDVVLLVDGAQSLGSQYHGRSCLSYGLASSTSFHAAKILTTVEGGMIFTDDKRFAEKIQVIRNQGESQEKYIHHILGGNYRMTDVTAAFAVKQLDRFDATLRHRQQQVHHYKKELQGIVDFLPVRKDSVSCNFIFLIFVDRRDELAVFLKEHGVDTRKIYPRTIPQQPLYNQQQSFPVAERFCQRSLSLPLYATLSFDEIHYVCEKVKEFMKS